MSTKQQDEDPRHERKVIDPVTHHRITIHDVSKVELEQIPPPLSDKQERDQRKRDDGKSSVKRHDLMDQVVHELTSGSWWEDPLGDQHRARIQTAIVASMVAGIGAFAGLFVYWSFNRSFGRQGPWGVIDLLSVVIGCVALPLVVLAGSIGFRLFQDEPKKLPPFNSTAREDIRRLMEHNGTTDGPETVAWLNSLLKSLWPIINPGLFTPVADMLEDTLQASLPKFIYGVKVADLGQGSEPVRVVGIRWLEAGRAAQEVEGMQAEEGDFINLELAVSYRSKSTTAAGLKARAGNIHILMQFWIAGGIMVPVWVELNALLATMRLRIQLTPNPPFLATATLTLLGRPKISLKCTPLAKNLFNVMDVPMLSNWIQSTIDDATTEYVAPRSIDLDLKAMLAGKPKMDTDALGVIVITIRRAYGIGSDTAKKLIRNPLGKGADMYVTVGWMQWGKPIWSTRIISKQGKPVWEETTAVLVGAAEMNSLEGLRLQIWDSDKFTADDLHGTVDVPLAEIASNRTNHNQLFVRDDELKDARGKPAKGRLCWEVGYFEKTSLEQHLQKKNQDYAEVRERIETEAEKKLREAVAAGEDKKSEVEQQKKEDLKERSDEIVAASAPTEDWPSGILSIRIEQISGLEVDKIRESGVKAAEDEDDTGELPSAYCTIIINHQRVFRTRTKMKSDNPYFDAGTERFIRDWRNTTIIVAVRDFRLHEVDPLLGIVVMPLHEVLKHRSQWTGTVPIVGSIGYGRMRLALTFRSIQLTLPRRLMGWDVGTLEIYSPAKPTIQVPTEYATCKLVFSNQYAKGKMKPLGEGGWGEKHHDGRPIRLAVKKRYASCLAIQIHKAAVGPDVTPAFCTLWLKDIPDDEEVTVSLPVCRNVENGMTHAKLNATTELRAEEDLGRIEFKLRFWSGLSGYHHIIADKDKNMADVMEVLDCAEASVEEQQEVFPPDDAGITYSDDSDDDTTASGSTAPSDEIAREEGEEQRPGEFKVARDTKGPFKNFRAHNKELQRKHRGLMQWRAARNVAWIRRGAQERAVRVGDRMFGQFKHRDKEPEIETEV